MVGESLSSSDPQLPEQTLRTRAAGCNRATWNCTGLVIVFGGGKLRWLGPESGPVFLTAVVAPAHLEPPYGPALLLSSGLPSYFHTQGPMLWEGGRRIAELAWLQCLWFPVHMRSNYCRLHCFSGCHTKDLVPGTITNVCEAREWAACDLRYCTAVVSSICSGGLAQHCSAWHEVRGCEKGTLQSIAQSYT